MRVFFHFWKWMFLAGLLVGAQARGQIFSLAASASTDTITVSNSLTYTIALTNVSGQVLDIVAVTNSPSAQVQLLSYAGDQGNVSTNAASLTFNIGTLTNGQSVNMTMTVRPLSPGLLTNAIVVTTITRTNTAETNVVVQVNAVSSDLGVAFTGFPEHILVNDQVTYGVVVTNFSSGSSPAFVLTNTLPPDVLLKGVSPSNQLTISGSNLIFNFNSLAAGGFTNVQFTVQPTNAGLEAFSASIGGAGFVNTNADSFVSTNITVENFSGTLIATNLSLMGLDPQIGLMTNTIRLSNIGTDAVAAARVIVSGLTNRLYNAVGTNNGNPYVVYNNTLDTNQSVDLVMEYDVPTRLPITISNSQYTAVGVPAVDYSAPTGTNGVFDITRIIATNSIVLIEFQSIPGRSYTVLYSDNMSFSNALAAQPAIIAPADRTQWIDDGPPKTISAPTNAASRYYRVLLNNP